MICKATGPEGRVLKISREDWSENPRDEYDHVGHLWCWSRSLYLGSRAERVERGEPREDWESLETELFDEAGAVLVLPVFLYDHSGVALSTKPFDCPWDSGQVGVIWADAEGLKEAGGRIVALESILRAEVKEYSQYVNGEVLCAVVEDSQGSTIDSLGGFYGTPEELVEMMGDLGPFEKAE